MRLPLSRPYRRIPRSPAFVAPALASAILWGAASSAMAQPAEPPSAAVSKQDLAPGDVLDVSGRVVLDGDGGVRILAPKGRCFAVVGDLAPDLLDLVGREVTVEGEVASGRPQVGAQVGPSGARVHELDVFRIARPERRLVRGTFGNHAGQPVVETAAGVVVALTRSSKHLLGGLEGRTLDVRGWFFEGPTSTFAGSELLVRSVEARVVRPGYLSQPRHDRATGQTEYTFVSEVQPGDVVRVLEVSGYDPSRKLWKPAEAMSSDDLLFAEVELGRGRPGDPPFVGWLPAYKLEVGEAPAPALRSPKPAPQEPTSAEAPASAPSQGAAGLLQGSASQQPSGLTFPEAVGGSGIRAPRSFQERVRRSWQRVIAALRERLAERGSE